MSDQENVTGLSTSEAMSLQRQYGKNELASQTVRWWQILLRQFKSPFLYVLFGASGLALFLGETIDSLMILLFVLINTVLGFFQEYRSEQTLRLLKKYTQNQITAIRDGEETNIPTNELVPGDIIMLEPGDIIPADVKIVKTEGLVINESVLTGESKEVTKTNDDDAFSGTTVVSGMATANVVAIGAKSQYGKIAKLTTQTVRESTFEKELRRFSKFTLYVVVATLALVIVASLIIKGSPNFGDLLLFAIALAVSVIPEALPVVTTFSLSIGASRLAKKHVVVKRLSAIEDLGSIEVLCSDKTGTLTENKMRVQEVRADDPGKTLLYAHLSSLTSKTERNVANTAFDKAVTRKLTKTQKSLAEKYEVIHKIPFDPKRKRVMSVLEYKGLPAQAGKKEMIVRGSPEEVFALCKLGRSTKAQYSSWVEAQGDLGNRVLAVAKKDIKRDGFKDETGLHFVGMISFRDPIKPTTKDAIAQAVRLGIQVKILTGDSKEVAGAVAKAVGLIDSADKVITGQELDKMTVAKAHEAVNEYQVFARVSPEQKYKIITLLQEKHEVGFLGEGINDAPALKIANVAIVVNGASDIAKEAADIILLQNSLKVIVDGIHEGRSTFANTTKYITATMSANFGNFFAVALVSLVIPFLPMLPLQILLVNLLSDFPSIAVATDSVDHELVAAPTKYNLKSFATIALVLGGVSTLFDFVYFSTFVGSGEHILQTAWFMGSIITELIFIYSIRTKGFFLHTKLPSPYLMALSTIAGFVTIVVPFTPFGAEVFNFVKLNLNQFALVIGIAGIYFVSTELAKLGYYRLFDKK